MVQATYDKYNPISGGSRANLDADLPVDADGSFFGAVSLNASGRVVVGTGGQTGLFGVLVKNVARGPVGRWDVALHGGIPNPYAPIGAMRGDTVDIMQSGDIVNLDKTKFVAGKKWYAAADGTITDVETGNIPIGWTVEAGRLVVRVAP